MEKVFQSSKGVKLAKLIGHGKANQQQEDRMTYPVAIATLSHPTRPHKLRPKTRLNRRQRGRTARPRFASTLTVPEWARARVRGGILGAGAESQAPPRPPIVPDFFCRALFGTGCPVSPFFFVVFLQPLYSTFVAEMCTDSSIECVAVTEWDERVVGLLKAEGQGKCVSLNAAMSFQNTGDATRHDGIWQWRLWGQAIKRKMGALRQREGITVLPKPAVRKPLSKSRAPIQSDPSVLLSTSPLESIGPGRKPSEAVHFSLPSPPFCAPEGVAMGARLRSSPPGPRCPSPHRFVANCRASRTPKARNKLFFSRAVTPLPYPHACKNNRRPERRGPRNPERSFVGMRPRNNGHPRCIFQCPAALRDPDWKHLFRNATFRIRVIHAVMGTGTREGD
ncbi:unnamed protein product [Bursaphelenchus xylophilus]|uniref:(pine wood nematode) hypothetical protein n=1 Tax=Bursaphelenchus xylophilus TaxID=6326 RepID=A0A1I7RKI1_BURXY|nr:unnamed protein product [Bursaphelenchus xylophilus]CAG9131308.1 unnamed protein product [Bursaphelenchus xylophilus]